MAALLVALAAAVVAAAPNAALYTNVEPPARFRHQATMTLEIQDQAGINATCQPRFGAPPTGMKTDACYTGDKLVMPNPCDFPTTDTYAHLLCHEMGHANGWPATHGD